jgi:hypothetical protein
VNLEYYTQNCESFSRVFPYKRPWFPKNIEKALSGSSDSETSK